MSGVTDPNNDGLAIFDIGDVNSDKSMDLISIFQDGSGFAVHYYIRDLNYYSSTSYSIGDCLITSISFLPFNR